jgi:hypothetical protein
MSLMGWLESQTTGSFLVVQFETVDQPCMAFSFVPITGAPDWQMLTLVFNPETKSGR